MASTKQYLWVAHNRHNRKPRGVLVNRRSVGLVYINGMPFIYNADLVYHNQEVTLEQIYDDYDRKVHNPRRVIVVRRK